MPQGRDFGAPGVGHPGGQKIFFFKHTGSHVAYQIDGDARTNFTLESNW